MRGRFQGNTTTLAAGECVGRNFTQHIGESIQAYFSGYKMVAIIALAPVLDRKSTRLNSSHLVISYALFFFNDTATTEIYSLSLHDALPISSRSISANQFRPISRATRWLQSSPWPLC